MLYTYVWTKLVDIYSFYLYLNLPEHTWIYQVISFQQNAFPDTMLELLTLFQITFFFLPHRTYAHLMKTLKIQKKLKTREEKIPRDNYVNYLLYYLLVVFDIVKDHSVSIISYSLETYILLFTSKSSPCTQF